MNFLLCRNDYYCMYDHIHNGISYANNDTFGTKHACIYTGAYHWINTRP